MVTISRNTTDLAADERNALERLLATQLAENQRIVVQVMDVDAEVDGENVDSKGNPSRTAADYAILADLEDAEADRLTEAMVQRSPGRDIAL